MDRRAQRRASADCVYGMGHGLEFQMPAAYSAIVRSLENFPELAIFTIALCAPGVAGAEPVVRTLLLPAIYNGQRENAVFAAQTIPRGWESDGGHRIQETCGKPAQAPVPQTRIRFLLQKFQPVETLLLNRMMHHRIGQKIADVIGQRASDEKLHGKIVNTLGVAMLVRTLRQHPTLRQKVAYGAGKCLEALTRGCDPGIDHPVENQVPLVECILCPNQCNRAASILMEEFRDTGWRHYGRATRLGHRKFRILCLHLISCIDLKLEQARSRGRGDERCSIHSATPRISSLGSSRAAMSS